MSQIIRRTIPWLIIIPLFVIIMIDTIAIVEPIRIMADNLLGLSTVVTAFAVLLGIIMLTRSQVRRISRGQMVIESAVQLLCMWSVLLWGSFQYFFNGVSPTVEPFVQNVFQAITAPGDATMFSILAFFIASAAYRVFRLRDLDIGVLLGVAVIVMLAKAPIGEVIFGPGVIPLSDFALNVLAMPGRRALGMAMALATLGVAVQILLGYEKSWMGRITDEE